MPDKNKDRVVVLDNPSVALADALFAGDDAPEVMVLKPPNRAVPDFLSMAAGLIAGGISGPTGHHRYYKSPTTKKSHPAKRKARKQSQQSRRKNR
jgi:hypothetical protein